MFPISTQASFKDDEDRLLWWVGLGIAATVVCAVCAVAWQVIERVPLAFG
jgi:hypothetical protein